MLIIKLAAIDISITSLLKSSILFEASVVAGVAARQRNTYVMIPSALNWVGSVYH